MTTRNSTAQKLPKSAQRKFDNESEVHVIEGLIGCGKSTLIRSLQSSKFMERVFDDIVVLDEPINQSMLRAYLADRSRYAFPFQMNMAVKRAQMYRDAERLARQKPNRLVLIDRGLYGDQAFALAQSRLGLMQADDYALYCEEIGVGNDGSPPPLPLGFQVVYLRCEPRTSWQRTLKRALNEETAVYDEAYMSTLFAAHEEMLAEKEHVTTIGWDAERNVVGGLLGEADVRAYLESTA